MCSKTAFFACASAICLGTAIVSAPCEDDVRQHPPASLEDSFSLLQLQKASSSSRRSKNSARLLHVAPLAVADASGPVHTMLLAKSVVGQVPNWQETAAQYGYNPRSDIDWPGFVYGVSQQGSDPVAPVANDLSWQQFSQGTGDGSDYLASASAKPPADLNVAQPGPPSVGQPAQPNSVAPAYPISDMSWMNYANGTGSTVPAPSNLSVSRQPPGQASNLPISDLAWQQYSNGTGAGPLGYSSIGTEGSPSQPGDQANDLASNQMSRRQKPASVPNVQISPPIVTGNEMDDVPTSDLAWVDLRGTPNDVPAEPCEESNNCELVAAAPVSSATDANNVLPSYIVPNNSSSTTERLPVSEDWKQFSNGTGEGPFGHMSKGARDGPFQPDSSSPNDLGSGQSTPVAAPAPGSYD